ncbi:MAG TPA: heavy-metal-associated domain-containing protein [Nocardioides sp.]|nr:heavy-metal-associated domain-containing protein [Nocardioides sp.]
MSTSGETASYTVNGMTCGHCVASVTEEVAEIDGVRDVVVDLASGALTFASDRPVPRETVEAAVREAGYQLA